MKKLLSLSAFLVALTATPFAHGSDAFLCKADLQSAEDVLNEVSGGNPTVGAILREKFWFADGKVFPGQFQRLVRISETPLRGTRVLDALRFYYENTDLMLAELHESPEQVDQIPNSDIWSNIANQKSTRSILGAVGSFLSSKGTEEANTSSDYFKGMGTPHRGIRAEKIPVGTIVNIMSSHLGRLSGTPGVVVRNGRWLVTIETNAWTPTFSVDPKGHIEISRDYHSNWVELSNERADYQALIRNEIKRRLGGKPPGSIHISELATPREVKILKVDRNGKLTVKTGTATASKLYNQIEAKTVSSTGVRSLLSFDVDASGYSIPQGEFFSWIELAEKSEAE